MIITSLTEKKKKISATFCALTHMEQPQMGNSSADSFN